MTAAGPASTAARLARAYDLDLLDDPGDLPLYLALAARSDGPVLELAAGSGRLCVPLAAAGHRVVGVDNDLAMLDRAQARWTAATGSGADVPASGGALELVEADLLQLALAERFGLVVLALNSLLLLGSREAQTRALAVMARHLAPDGVAVVDIWLPGTEDLALLDGRVQLEWQRPDPDTGETVAKLASGSFDPATATVTLHQLFDRWPASGGPVERVARTDLLRLVGADELVAMADAAGLRIESLGGDHELTPFGRGAERAVLVAGPRPPDGLV